MMNEQERVFANTLIAFEVLKVLRKNKRQNVLIALGLTLFIGILVFLLWQNILITALWTALALAFGIKIGMVRKYDLIKRIMFFLEREKLDISHLVNLSGLIDKYEKK